MLREENGVRQEGTLLAALDAIRRRLRKILLRLNVGCNASATVVIHLSGRMEPSQTTAFAL